MVDPDGTASDAGPGLHINRLRGRGLRTFENDHSSGDLPDHRYGCRRFELSFADIQSHSAVAVPRSAGGDGTSSHSESASQFRPIGNSRTIRLEPHASTAKRGAPDDSLNATGSRRCKFIGEPRVVFAVAISVNGIVTLIRESGRVHDGIVGIAGVDCNAIPAIAVRG